MISQQPPVAAAPAGIALFALQQRQQQAVADGEA